MLACGGGWRLIFIDLDIGNRCILHAEGRSCARDTRQELNLLAYDTYPFVLAVAGNESCLACASRVRTMSQEV